MFVVYALCSPLLARSGLRRAGVSPSAFAVLCLLFTVFLAKHQWFAPGADAVIAGCFTMAVANIFSWCAITFLVEDDADESVHKAPKRKSTSAEFCSKITHDYAVSPQESVFAITHINSDRWTVLRDELKAMSAAERQGFYANLNYSSISERALQEVINNHPDDADAHVLMGHVKLCFVKRLGLKPAGKLNEPMALAIGQAFRHFNLALRIKVDDAEALCGLIMAKGFTGMSGEHILYSLDALLQADPEHLHGVIAAARFLVLSTSDANEFVALIESAVDGRSDATVAIAKIIAHIECMGLVENGSNNSIVIADIYKQLQCYKRETDSLGTWQKGIADNIVAYVLQLIGDKEELRQYLKQIDGLVSPYPWRSNSVS